MADNPQIDVEFKAVGAEKFDQAMKRLGKSAESGVQAFQKGVGGLADIMLEPIILLAAGASKTEAAVAAAGSAVEYKLLGPLGILSGVAAGALISINKLALKFKDLGIEGAESIEMLETQFKPLLRSAELARERVQELVDITKETPFQQEGVIQANKTLQILTQGALATREGMMLVGDAAATAGSDMQDVAKWTGRLYDALQSGVPVGRAAVRMQELGLITGNTRRALISMQESGASFTDMWRVVESELKKAEGSMKDLSVSLGGLKSTLEDTQIIFGQTFAKGFLEGEKASIETTTQVLDALTPVVDHFGKQFGWMFNMIEGAKKKFVDFTTGLSGFKNTVILAGHAIGVILGGAVLTGIVNLGLFFGSLLKARGQAKLLETQIKITSATMTAAEARTMHLAAAKGHLGKAMGALVTLNLKEAQTQLGLALAHSKVANSTKLNQAATEHLAASKMHAAAASKALAAGNIAEAASHQKAAAASALAAANADRARVAHTLLMAPLRGVAAAAKWAGNMILFMIKSMLFTKIGIIATVLTGVTTALIVFAQKASEARKAIMDYKNATDDLKDTITAQNKAVRTYTDLMKAQQSTMNALTEAKLKQIDAERAGNAEMVKAAEERIKWLTAESNAINSYNQARLALSDDRKQELSSKFDQKEEVERIRREAERSRMTPEAADADREKELEEKLRKREAAQRERDAMKETELAQRQESTVQGERNSEITALEAELKRLNRVKEAVEADLGEAFSGDADKTLIDLRNKLADKFGRTKTFKELNPSGKAVTERFYRDQIKDLNTIEEKSERLKVLYKESFDDIRGIDIGLGSESLVARLETAKRIFDEIQQKQDSLLRARTQLSELQGEDEPDENKIADKVTDIDKQQRQLDALEAAAKRPEIRRLEKLLTDKYKIDVVLGDASGLDVVNIELDALKKRLAEDLDPTRIEKLKQSDIDKDLERSQRNIEARLNSEKQIAQIRDEGLVAKLKELEVERKLLVLKRNRGALTKGEFEAGSSVIRAKEDQLLKDSSENRREAISKILIQGLERQAEAARRIGDIEALNAARKEADLLRDRSLREQLTREARKLFETEKQQSEFIQKRMAEEKAAREQQRAFEQEDRERKQRESVGGQNVDALKLQEDLRRGVGRASGAKESKAAAEAIQDALDLESLTVKFQKEGFGDQSESLARRQVALNQVQRKFDDLNALGEGKIVASSLAKIGGGGNVSGVDPLQSKVDVTNELLKQISAILETGLEEGGAVVPR